MRGISRQIVSFKKTGEPKRMQLNLYLFIKSPLLSRCYLCYPQMEEIGKSEISSSSRIGHFHWVRYQEQRRIRDLWWAWAIEKKRLTTMVQSLFVFWFAFDPLSLLVFRDHHQHGIILLRLTEFCIPKMPWEIRFRWSPELKESGRNRNLIIVLDCFCENRGQLDK